MTSAKHFAQVNVLARTRVVSRALKALGLEQFGFSRARSEAFGAFLELARIPMNCGAVSLVGEHPVFVELCPLLSCGGEVLHFILQSLESEV